MMANWDNQRSKKPQLDPNKISKPYLINSVIDGRKRINLVISYYYKKRNVEYLKGCKKRGVEPDKNRLFNKRNYKIIIFLDDDDLDFVGFMNVLYPKSQNAPVLD